MKTTLITAAQISVFTLAAATAFAAVTFNTQTGVGLVGKAEVMRAFGWSPKTLQSAAKAVRFSYEAEDTYKVACGSYVVDSVVVPRQVAIPAMVTTDVRGQVTGFSLNGFGKQTTDGTVPVVGGPCPGGAPGVVTLVTPTGSSGSLYVFPGPNASGVELQ